MMRPASGHWFPGPGHRPSPPHALLPSGSAMTPESDFATGETAGIPVTVRQTFFLPCLLLVFLASAVGCTSLDSPKPATVAVGSPSASPFPGPRADGSMLLPNQWTLRPAGLQILVPGEVRMEDRSTEAVFPRRTGGAVAHELLGAMLLRQSFITTEQLDAAVEEQKQN